MGNAELVPSAPAVAVRRGRPPSPPPRDRLLAHTAALFGDRSDVSVALDAWLRAQDARNTIDAYANDARYWLAWCARESVDPMAARRVHVDSWRRELLDGDEDEDVAPIQPRTLARRLASLSSFYGYLVSENVLTTGNPVKDVKRPKILRDESPTNGLTSDQAKQLIAAAKADGLRSQAIVTLLLDCGLRVSALTGLDVESRSTDSGHQVIRVRLKGGATKRKVLPPAAARAIDAYLAHRAETVGVDPAELTGPVFVRPGSGARIDRGEVFKLVRKLAEKAGIEEWIGTHSLRHTAITLALENGAALHVVQDFAGHADPRTTQGYNRRRDQLDTDPAYLIASVLSDEEGST